ncbi:MAG: 4-hydroxy-tetrahydrodipicolinate synthase [Candidatus Cloacimonetes bacterium]|nr:4-hydroxy-tetrahydrodipicolinate synthase [Candidatus Cloacimonadota bacterium]
MKLNEVKCWTALVTPLNDNGSIDFISLSTLVEEQSRAKNGILLLGSTGESLCLSLEEKKSILSYVINLAPDTPLMVGVGGINIENTTNWVEYINTLNLDAYLLVTPLYMKPSRHGQTAWFQQLLDLAIKPCMLYNVPSRTGISLHIETVKDLQNHENFWAIKEASGSVESFAEFVEAAPKIRVYSGDDGLLPQFAKHGAKGLVSVSSNVWPHETNLYVKQCLEGSFSSEETWDFCSAAMFCSTNPIPVKALLDSLNKISTPNLKAPLTILDFDNHVLVAKAHAKMMAWYDTEMQKFSAPLVFER